MFQIQYRHYRHSNPESWAVIRLPGGPLEYGTLAEAQAHFVKVSHPYLENFQTRNFRILDLETLKVHPVAEEPTSEKPRFRAANIPVRSTDWVLAEEYKKRGAKATWFFMSRPGDNILGKMSLATPPPNTDAITELQEKCLNMVVRLIGAESDIAALKIQIKTLEQFVREGVGNAS